MIAFVKGQLEDISEENAVIDVGNMGINVKISARTASLLPGMGKTVKLFTYTLVREDTFNLYGFLTRDDLDIFKKLITVNGIGPKGGLAILSVLSADELRFAVLSGDSVAIARAPGVGKKTAERVILDLKDKISLEDTLVHKEMQTSKDEAASVDGRARTEAVEALTALGYSSSEALRAVKSVPEGESMDVETLLKQALKNLF